MLDILPHRNTRSSPELHCMSGVERAMGALAHALKLDPIELRRRNDTRHEPIRGVPWASRGSMCCFDAGAEAIGWTRRNPKPWSMWEGDWPVGIGCGSTNSKPRRG